MGQQSRIQPVAATPKEKKHYESAKPVEVQVIGDLLSQFGKTRH